MLSSYFDDSGTHGESDVVLWAGLVGTVEDFNALDARWKELLAEPLPGKPSLPYFQLSSFRASRPPFQDYDPVEAEHVRFLFREAIIQSPVFAIGYAVDVNAWHKVVPGTELEGVAGPESCAFGLCVREVLNIEDANRQGMAMYFDEGREGLHLQQVQRGAWELPPDGAKTSTFSFMEVKNCPALQAADTVANEYYRFCKALKADRQAEPDPHLASFLSKLADYEFGFMGEQQILDLAAKMRS